MDYKKYVYLFPPRPEQTTHYQELDKYDNRNFAAQPKYNGTCCNVFISENEVIVMNRHKRKITSEYSHIDFKGMHSGKGWMVVCGEFLNKNKKGEDGNSFNLKFVIWDILVYNGKYLIGSTFGERLDLLESLFPSVKMMVDKDKKLNSFNYLCYTSYENVFKAPTFLTHFSKIYEQIVPTDLYEGLVIKRLDAKLTVGLNERNNFNWQVKCRKATKNYIF